MSPDSINRITAIIVFTSLDFALWFVLTVSGRAAKNLWGNMFFTAMFFVILPLLCIIVNTNQRVENGIGLGTRLTVHIALQTSNNLLQQRLLAYNLWTCYYILWQAIYLVLVTAPMSPPVGQLRLAQQKQMPSRRTSLQWWRERPLQHRWGHSKETWLTQSKFWKDLNGLTPTDGTRSSNYGSVHPKIHIWMTTIWSWSIFKFWAVPEYP